MTTPDLRALQRAEEEALEALLRDVEAEPARLAALAVELERQDEDHLRAVLADLEEEPARVAALLADVERGTGP